MKKIIITSIVSMLIGTVVAQQAPMYSQYMFNMMNINPAYTGSRQVPTTTVLFRKQWMGFAGAPTTGSVTFDNRVTDKNHSWGAQMYYDKLGIEKTTGVQGFYSFSAPFERANLSIGLSFGALNYSLDRKRTNAWDPNDPTLQTSISKILPTAGIGALFSTEYWYIGISAPALFKTKIMADGTSSVFRRAGAEGHYFLTAGFHVPLSDAITLKPSTLIKKVDGGGPWQVDLNMNVWINNLIGFGASFRTADALVGIMELQLSNNLRLGYAYDHGISKENPYNINTHEMMLRHELGGKKGKKIVSPRLF